MPLIPSSSSSEPSHVGAWSGSDVTVTICAYQAADVLPTALRSICEQTEPPGAVIVVDDGSEDATVELTEQWADRLPLHVDRLAANGGVGVARGRALNLVRTPLVATLDADDAWLPEHLAALLRAYRPGRLVVARDIHWGPDDRRRAVERTLPAPDEQLRAMIDHNLASAGVLFALADQAAVGGYRPSLRCSEDWDLYLRMVRAGTRLVLTDQPTLLYRVAPDSLSAGYATARSDVQVLELAREEAADEREQRWIDTALLRRRARLELAEALDATRLGNPASARRHARRAFRGGSRRTRCIAAGLLVAPRLALAVRDAVSGRRTKRSGADSPDQLE